MHVTSVSPNEDISVELIVLKGKCEHVELRHNDRIVVLQRELRIVLVGKTRILQSFLSQFFDVGIVPKLSKCFDFLMNKDCVKFFTTLPNIGLKILSSEDYKVGISLEHLVEKRKIVLICTFELSAEITSFDVVHKGDLGIDRFVTLATEYDCQ